MILSPAILPDGGLYKTMSIIKTLGIFNKLTLAGLYDIKSLKTSGRRACQNGKLIPFL